MLILLAIVSIAAMVTMVAFEGARSPTAVVLWLVNIGTIGALAALVKREATMRRIELPDLDLRWRSFGRTRICTWEDIADVHVSDIGEVTGLPSRLALGVLGINLNRRVVAIELKRRLRQPVWGETARTRGFGLPTARRQYVEPVDMDGFLEAAARSLNRKSPEERWGESRLA